MEVAVLAVRFQVMAEPTRAMAERLVRPGASTSRVGRLELVEHHRTVEYPAAVSAAVSEELDGVVGTVSVVLTAYLVAGILVVGPSLWASVVPPMEWVECH
jgi:hypothetical protein